MGMGLLIGRQRELDRLGELLARSKSSNGAAAIVEGPAGIGKTALLGESSRVGAGSQFRVLRGTGAQLEREYAFGVGVLAGRGPGPRFEGSSRRGCRTGGGCARAV